MNNIKFVIAKLLMCFGLLFFSISCATFGSNVTLANDISIVETEERMFWEIHGIAEDGSVSTIYIQGTIHVGDERLSELSPYVLNAFETSDRLVAEIGSKEMGEAMLKIAGLALASADFSRDVYSFFNAQQNKYLIANFSKTDLDNIKMLEPWAISSLLIDKAMIDSGYTSERGLDNVFYDKAKELDKTVEGLDDMQAQLDLVTYADFTFDEQVLLVGLMIDEARSVDQAELLHIMYQVYLDDDKQSLTELLSDDLENETELDKRYNKLIMDDRNEIWAETIVSYINEGGTTFIFAGAAHFLVEKTVFDYLEEYR